MRSRFEKLICDPELLDVVNVYPLPEHILYTIVDMVNVSRHEVLALFLLGSLGEGSPRGHNADSDC